MCQHLSLCGITTLGMYSSSKGVIETPTLPIHSIPFCQNVRDDDCNKEESKGKSKGEHLSVDCVGNKCQKLLTLLQRTGESTLRLLTFDTTTEQKFLGLVFDSQLRWCDQVASCL